MNNVINVDRTVNARSSNETVCGPCTAGRHHRCTIMRRMNHGVKVPCACRTCKKAASSRPQDALANAPTG
jgi:hypothetical protein